MKHLDTDDRIQQLDPVVANQIAAGEVVERPSSVVKELIENSLDAGADTITVRLTDGGRRGIQIIDNGHGMGPRDARLAFSRHATSKISRADELMRIVSYGFRGEALASILSVAKVVMSTRREGDELGVCLEGGGSVELTERPVACPVGTDLRIDELFFNVPARQKFLRTAATELGHVIRLIDAVALAHPHLALTLTQNGRRISHFPKAEDLASRAAVVFGEQLAPHLYGIIGREDYAVDGQLSDPETHRGSASGLIFLVDGRPVVDKTLQHAVVQAYGTLLERRRFPVGVLRLTCPPGTVDVNVHPAKTEVRFVSSQAVHRAVGRAVRAMLVATPWVERQVLGEPKSPYFSGQTQGTTASETIAPAVTRSKSADAGATIRPMPGSQQAPRSRPLEATWQTHTHAARPAWSPVASVSPPGQNSTRADASPAPINAHPHMPPAHSGAASTLPPQVATSPSADASAFVPQGATAGAAEDEPRTQAGLWGRIQSLRFVGQVGRCFLIFDDGDAMVLLDQHAAHERVLFERFVQAFRTNGFPSQRMLIPRVVPLGPDAAAALLEQESLTKPLGFELAAAGERAVMVRAFPDVLRPNQIEAEIRALATSVLEGGRGQSTVEHLERAAATLACHAAVRAGDVVTSAWVDGLLTTLATVDLSAYCPHGRPALTRVPFDQLGRLFDRT